MPAASNIAPVLQDSPPGAVPAFGNPGYGYDGAQAVNHSFESAMGGVPCVDWDTPYNPMGESWQAQIDAAVADHVYREIEDVSLETFHSPPAKRGPGRPKSVK